MIQYYHGICSCANAIKPKNIVCTPGIGKWRLFELNKRSSGWYAQTAKSGFFNLDFKTRSETLVRNPYVSSLHGKEKRGWRQALQIERKIHQKPYKQTKKPYNLSINKNTQKALETGRKEKQRTAQALQKASTKAPKQKI